MPHSHIYLRREQHSSMLVSDAVADFLASTEVKRLRPNTQSEYRYNLTQFASFCNTHGLVQDRVTKTWKAVKADSKHSPIYLHRVDDQVVYCFLEHIQVTHKPGRASSAQLSTHTLYQFVKDIKRLLSWCLLDEQYSEHVKAITLQRIKKPTLEQTAIDIFDTSAIAGLFRSCEREVYEHLQVRDKALIALMLDTGIRCTELITLTIGHVFLDSRDPHIKILGKGRKWREVGFGEQTRRAMQKYLRMFREPTIEHEVRSRAKAIQKPDFAQTLKQETAQRPFFVNRAGQPFTKSGLYQLIARLGEWAELDVERCSPHVFRHTFACRFWRETGDIYRLSKILGHSSISVTERYLRGILQSEARRGAPSIVDNL